MDTGELELFAYARRLSDEADRAARDVADELVLYRAVGQRELADILRSDAFRPDERGGSRTAKLFTASAADATRFGRRTYEANGRAFAIVEVRVPRAIAGRLRRGFANGMAHIAVPAAQLATFNAVARIRVLPWPRRR